MQNAHAFDEGLAQAVSSSPDITWSVCVRDQTNKVLASFNAEQSLSTASVGKLLLLALLAQQLEAGRLDARVQLARSSVPIVGDSGLWQHLHVEALGLEDIALLIASVSDNHATNVLLNYVGLDEVKMLGEALGLRHTSLLDRVRSVREPPDAPALSVGSAEELSLLMHRIDEGTLVSAKVSERLRKWLKTSMDLSMVASAFHLDPLAHFNVDGGFLVMNKTGTDRAVRADAGNIHGAALRLSYAAIANWPEERIELRDAAMNGMNSIGRILRTVIS